MKKRIYLSPPHLSEEAMPFLSDAVASNWIAPVGPHVDAFEQELGEVLNIAHVVTTNSGTSAIHLGLLALGVQPQDEVICSSFTFCASANPIIYCGGVPVFVDSEEETWNMDPDLLEEAITDRLKKKGKAPKAIVLVHLYGMPARMTELMNVARKYEIPVLEDSAEALGSEYENKHVGTFGRAGILSFNGNKIITSSGGGAIFSSDKTLVERIRYLRQDAKEPLPYYEHREVGYNYRMSNVLAALGRSQLKALRARVERRRSIFDFYSSELATIPGIAFQGDAPGMQPNRWLTAALFRQERGDAERVRLALEKENIESRPLWKPMHLQPVFARCPYYGRGVSDELFARGLCLPSGSGMTGEDMQRIAHTIITQFV